MSDLLQQQSAEIKSQLDQLTRKLLKVCVFWRLKYFCKPIMLQIYNRVFF